MRLRFPYLVTSSENAPCRSCFQPRLSESYVIELTRSLKNYPLTTMSRVPRNSKRRSHNAYSCGARVLGHVHKASRDYVGTVTKPRMASAKSLVYVPAGENEKWAKADNALLTKWTEICRVTIGDVHAFVENTKRRVVQIPVTTLRDVKQGPSLQGWQPIFNRIDDIGRYERDWNSYGANALPATLVAQSIAVAELLARRGYKPIGVDPTADDSIVITCEKGGVVVECEIVSSTEYGLAILSPGEDRFLDAASLEAVNDLL
jgi:hypothetical protein